jgi:ADP-dependent NAD(P)H-hydrate dehydratase
MTDAVVVTAGRLREWPLPEPGDDKEQRGRVLVVGGTASTPGAVRLAGESALRAGAGKLKLATVASTATQLGVAVPEAGVVGLAETDEGDIAESAAEVIAEEADSVDAVLIGSGCMNVEATVRLLELVLRDLRTPVVLDGLASAYLTEHPAGMSGHDAGAVLTVNVSELAHVAGVEEDEVADDALSATEKVAARCGLAVLCGGTDKHVVAPDGRAWKIAADSPGLGVSGSGDVQAGIVAGLLARGAAPEQSAVWGGFVHAAVGERLTERVGTIGYLARELPPVVPGVLAGLGS